MKFLSLFIFTILNCKASIDYKLLAESIIPVEGVPYYSFIGRNGERSPYQITKNVWKQHSNKSFSSASDKNNEEEVNRVVINHLRWIYKNIENPNVYRVALAYNAGVGAVNRGKLNDKQFCYAERVRNIYLEKVKLCKK